MKKAEHTDVLMNKAKQILIYIYNVPYTIHEAAHTNAYRDTG